MNDTGQYNQEEESGERGRMGNLEECEHQGQEQEVNKAVNWKL